MYTIYGVYYTTIHSAYYHTLYYGTIGTRMVLENPATSPLLSDIGPKLSLYLLKHNELLELCKYFDIYAYMWYSCFLYAISK